MLLEPSVTAQRASAARLDAERGRTATAARALRLLLIASLAGLPALPDAAHAQTAASDCYAANLQRLDELLQSASAARKRRASSLSLALKLAPVEARLKILQAAQLGAVGNAAQCQDIATQIEVERGRLARLVPDATDAVTAMPPTVSAPAAAPAAPAWGTAQVPPGTPAGTAPMPPGMQQQETPCSAEVRAGLREVQQAAIDMLRVLPEGDERQQAQQIGNMAVRQQADLSGRDAGTPEACALSRQGLDDARAAVGSMRANNVMLASRVPPPPAQPAMRQPVFTPPPAVQAPAARPPANPAERPQAAAFPQAAASPQPVQEPAQSDGAIDYLACMADNRRSVDALEREGRSLQKSGQLNPALAGNLDAMIAEDRRLLKLVFLPQDCAGLSRVIAFQREDLRRRTAGHAAAPSDAQRAAGQLAGAQQRPAQPAATAPPALPSAAPQPAPAPQPAVSPPAPPAPQAQPAQPLLSPAPPPSGRHAAGRSQAAAVPSVAAAPAPAMPPPPLSPAPQPVAKPAPAPAPQAAAVPAAKPAPAAPAAPAPPAAPAAKPTGGKPEHCQQQDDQKMSAEMRKRCKAA